MAGRRSTPAKRHAGMLVHHLLWSMAYRKPVRITLAAGAGRRTGRVVRVWCDEARGSNEKGSQASTVVVVMENGSEIAVNSIEAVERPAEGTERAFV